MGAGPARSSEEDAGRHLRAGPRALTPGCRPDLCPLSSPFPAPPPCPGRNLIPGSHEKGAEGHSGAVGGVLPDAGTCPGCGTRGVFRARPAGSEAGRSDAEPSREGPALAGREGGSEEEDVRTRRQARVLCPAPRAPGGRRGWRGGGLPASAPHPAQVISIPQTRSPPLRIGARAPRLPRGRGPGWGGRRGRRAHHSGPRGGADAGTSPDVVMVPPQRAQTLCPSTPGPRAPRAS